TDAFGLLASTETTFNLQVDGDPVLFFDRSLLIGPGSSQTQNFSTRLTTTVPLQAGVSHCVVLEADSESQSQTRSVTAPPPVVLLLSALLAFLWIVNRRRAINRSTASSG